MSGPCTDCGGPDYQTLMARITALEAENDAAVDTHRRAVVLLLGDREKATRGFRQAEAAQRRYEKAEAERDTLKTNHCQDCCCAQSWTALGVTEYDAQSIPEHIAEVRAERDVAIELVTMARQTFDADGNGTRFLSEIREDVLKDVQRLAEMSTP